MSVKKLLLKNYIKMLQKIVKENPEAKDFILVSSSDDEGNSFSQVLFAPTLGIFTEDGEFYSGDEDMDILKEFHPEIVDPKPNAICVN